MFCMVGDDGVFGVVLGVGFVSIVDEIVPVFPTSAEQTRGHDKISFFSSQRGFFQTRKHLFATGNPVI